MCAVIYMEQMKTEYYNSLLYDNVTRHGCRHKVKKARGYTSSSKGLLAKGTYERKAYRFAQ
jgi:hypothetical protein